MGQGCGSFVGILPGQALLHWDPRPACIPLPAEGPGHAGDGAYGSGSHTLECPGKLLKILDQLYQHLWEGPSAPASFRAAG